MFKKITGLINDKHYAILMQRKLRSWLDTEDGSEVLAWLVNIYLINNDSIINAAGGINNRLLDRDKLAYVLGQQDFIRWLVDISNIDFTQLLAEPYN